MKKVIAKLLMSMGMSPHYKGFTYLVHIISLVVANDNVLSNVHKELYPAVGEEFSVPPGNVERCIRTAINKFWEEGDLEIATKIFGEHQKNCPSNSKFIATVSQYLLINENLFKNT